MPSPCAFGRARTAFVAPNDQPWAQPFRFWLDAARTQPLQLSGAGAWAQWPGGSSKVVLEAPVAGNVVTVGLAQADLEALRLGTWWGEMQIEVEGDTAGQLRFDLGVVQGFGSGLGATKSLTYTADVIVLAGAPLDIVTLPVGPGAAQYMALSATAQARLTELNLPATNVESAILALANALKALTGETPEQETIFSTT